MVNLTRIYTRTGDDGSTALGDFSRTSKTDSRLAAYADVDEANCAIGFAVTTGGRDEEIVTLAGVEIGQAVAGGFGGVHRSGLVSQAVPGPT